MKSLWALFSFTGRMRRRDFWSWTVAVWLISIMIVADGGVTLPHVWQMTPGMGRRIALLTMLPLFAWVSMALLTKRLHDRDLSMFMVLRAITPVVGWIWGFSECCNDGTPGANRFGASPKPLDDVSDTFK